MPSRQGIGANEGPLPVEMVVQRSGRTHRAGQRERAEPDLVRPVQDPRTAAAVTVEPHAHVAVVRESDRVFSLVVGHQDRAVPALELHKLPRRVAEASEMDPRWSTARYDAER